MCPAISPQSLNPLIALLCGRSRHVWRDSQQKHFAGILLATAPDDPATFDLSVRNLKPVLKSWVGATITKIAEENTFSAAWKNLIPTPDTNEEVLASAQAAHAAGALFKNVKGRQPPEFAPEPEEAEVDDFTRRDDESQAYDQGLLSADIDPEEAPHDTLWQPTTQEHSRRQLEAGGAETPIAAPAEQDEPRSAADAAATASEEANIKKVERLMALRLIYGRYSPKPERLRRLVLDRRAPACCEGETPPTEEGQWPWQRGKQQTRMIEDGCFVHLRKSSQIHTKNKHIHAQGVTDRNAGLNLFLSYRPALFRNLIGNDFRRKSIKSILKQDGSLILRSPRETCGIQHLRHWKSNISWNSWRSSFCTEQ